MNIDKTDTCAIFIDAENMTGWIKNNGLSRHMQDIETSGKIIVRKAYGSWSSQNLSVLQGTLNRNGFDMVHTYHPVNGKNSADITLSIDVMECLFNHDEIDKFYIATGDSDFSPLFRKISSLNKQVVGIGPRSKLSDSVKSLCSDFIYTDAITNNNAESNPPAANINKPDNKTIVNIDQNYLKSLLKKKGWTYIKPGKLQVLCKKSVNITNMSLEKIAAIFFPGTINDTQKNLTSDFLQILIKSKLAKFIPNSAGDKIYSIKLGDNYLRSIDTALLSRLLTSLNKDEIKKGIMKNICYGKYTKEEFESLYQSVD